MLRWVSIIVVVLVAGCNNTSPPLMESTPYSEPATGTEKAQKKRRGVLYTEPARLQSLADRQEPALGTKSSSGEEHFKSFLNDKEYYVLRQQGTERAFSGEYNDHKGEGTYHCRACNAPLYTSDTKFDSRTGWPSFYEAIPNRVLTRPDKSHGMDRTEIICAHCDSHLGHVFNDGPQPTGMRHCANSLSLVFQESEQ